MNDEAPVEFFSRWSRRKAAVARAEPDAIEATEVADAAVDPSVDAVPVAEPVAEPVADEAALPEDRIDERTGKRYAELTDEDMPDPDSLGADSDVRMFMAPQISSSLRIRALNQIFRSGKYNQMCVCAEYADDYTHFEPLGDIIPHDMKSAIAREAEKLRSWLLESGEDELTQEEAEARVLEETQARRLQREAQAESAAQLDAAQPDADALETEMDAEKT